MIAGVATGRVIAIEGLRNLRDVGGLPAAEGRVVRRGMLFRSDAPVALSPGGVEAIRALELATTADLRSSEHAEFSTSMVPAGIRRAYFPLSPPPDVAGRNLIDQVMEGDVLDFTVEDLTAIYRRFVDYQAERFGRVIAHFADPRNLPCLVHCRLGKDRTGLVIAMTLDVLGVPREVIVNDFEATTYFCRAEIEPVLARTGTEWSRVAALFTAPGDVLERTFEHIGPVRRYLRERGGIPSETLDRIAELLLEPA